MEIPKPRHAARFVAFVALALLAAPALVAADEPAAADPRADLLAHMERTQKLFLDSIAGLSEAQWNWKPAPDKWSVGECAEHITRTEPMLRGLIAKMLSEPTDPAVLEKSHGKADKVGITKFRRRKHYLRQKGHRQPYTEVKVTGITAA